MPHYHGHAQRDRVPGKLLFLFPYPPSILLEPCTHPKPVLPPLPWRLPLPVPREETRLQPHHLAGRCRQALKLGYFREHQARRSQPRRSRGLCARVAGWTGPHEHNSYRACRGGFGVGECLKEVRNGSSRGSRRVGREIRGG